MRRRLFSFLGAFFLVAGTISTGRATELKGLPTSPADMGHAFVSAWLEFRRDLDVLGGAKVHPAQFDEWFDKMPDFLLRDVIRLATDHEVLIAAASRLAALDGKENRPYLQSLKKRYENGPLDPPLSMLLIRAGDTSALKQAVDCLKSAVDQRQMEGAIVLAGAGDPRGLTLLRLLIRAGGERSDMAAMALGRYGKLSDEALVRKHVGQTGGPKLLTAALGEIALRKYFPYQYRAFLKRNRVFDKQTSQMGLYETWLIISEQAVAGGARTSGELLSVLREMRRAPPKWPKDSALFERHLAAFNDFWVAQEEQLNTPLHAAWPTDFESAMAKIAAGSDKGQQEEDDIGARVAAAISICAALGAKVGYRDLAFPTPDLNIISPFGERAVDGDMATTWYIDREATLIAATPEKTTIDSLLFMLSCPDSATPPPLAVEISGESPDSERWTVKATLSGEQRYFQTVAIKKRTAKKVTIKFAQTKKGPPACLAELRARMR